MQFINIYKKSELHSTIIQYGGSILTSQITELLSETPSSNYIGIRYKIWGNTKDKEIILQWVLASIILNVILGFFLGISCGFQNEVLAVFLGIVLVVFDVIASYQILKYLLNLIPCYEEAFVLKEDYDIFLGNQKEEEEQEPNQISKDNLIEIKAKKIK